MNNVDKVWKAFSKLKNIDLKYKERKQLNVTQSHYLINYTNEVAIFSFIGILMTSAEGTNTDKTSIIIEYENRLDITNFELENTSKTKCLVFEDTTTEFEKNILKKLNKFSGNHITLKDNFIKIDTDHIFSTIEEFEHVTDLISNLKTTGSQL